jgi:hypothetical protein
MEVQRPNDPSAEGQLETVLRTTPEYKSGPDFEWCGTRALERVMTIMLSKGYSRQGQ